MKLTDNLYFYPGEDGPTVWGFSTCNSLVVRGRGLLLTDPGPAVGPHLARVRRAMHRDGLRFRDIRLIFLTHAHIDHAPAAGPLADKLGAEVLAHPLEKPMLQNPSRFLRDEIEAAGPALDQLLPLPAWLIEAAVFAGAGPHPPCNRLTPVREGDDPGIGIPASVVELPGHRPGEIGLHLPADRALITGDLVNRLRHDLPSLNLPLADIDQAVDSIRKMRALDLEILAPAHERPILGRDRIRKLLDDAIARCADNKRIAAEYLKRNPEPDLAGLGRILRARNEGIPLYEDIPLAFVVLRSLGYYSKA